ncbi:MAG: hypothetical protein ACK4UP_12945 [Spirosomataceae bacterium]
MLGFFRPFDENQDIPDEHILHLEAFKNWKKDLWELERIIFKEGEQIKGDYFPLKDLFDIKVGVLDTSQERIKIKLRTGDEEEAICIRPGSFENQTSRLRPIETLLSEEDKLLETRKSKPSKKNLTEEITKEKSDSKVPELHETDARILQRGDYLVLSKREMKGFSMLKSFPNDEKSAHPIQEPTGEHTEEDLKIPSKWPLVVSHHFIQLRPKKIALQRTSVDFLHILLDIMIQRHFNSSDLPNFDDISSVPSNKSASEKMSLKKLLEEKEFFIPQADEEGEKYRVMICEAYKTLEKIEEDIEKVRTSLSAILYKKLLNNDIIT